MRQRKSCCIKEHLLPSSTFKKKDKTLTTPSRRPTQEKTKRRIQNEKLKTKKIIGRIERTKKRHRRKIRQRKDIDKTKKKKRIEDKKRKDEEETHKKDNTKKRQRIEKTKQKREKKRQSERNINFGNESSIAFNLGVGNFK